MPIRLSAWPGILCLLAVLLAPAAAPAAVLVPTNATWRFLRGTNEASLPDPAAWQGTNFSDTAFADAAAPFWYGDVRPGGTQLGDMLNNYSCIFLRRTMVVSNLSTFCALRFDYFIDDGFIVWVNGAEVLRVNVEPGAVTRTTLATNQPVDPAPWEAAVVGSAADFLREGTNLVAIQVFNTSLGSSDFGFDCAISTLEGETARPVLVSVDPAPGTRPVLEQVTVTFSEPVTGVEANDLRINTEPVAQVAGSGATYTFRFPPVAFGTADFSWAPDHGIRDLSVCQNRFDASAPGATWSYTLVDTVPPVVSGLFPSPGLPVRALSQVEVTFSEEVTGVDAGDLQANGQPATTLSRVPGGPHVFQWTALPPGPAVFAWVPGHGITDQAPAPNPFAGGSWTNVIDPGLPLADVVISEFLAASVAGLLDEDGEPTDWIEIRNRGTFAVDLAGWSLSDDADTPGLWLFPSRVLGPGEHLLVHASGKNRRGTGPGARLHANFQLAADGEFLGLYNAESPRVLVSGFAAGYPEQRNDYSYGLDPQGAFRHFAAPTPGAPNGPSDITGVVAPVQASSARGFYSQPFSLVLSCATPGAAVRYTTDGSEPTAATGEPYTQPLRLTNSVVLRAAAFRTNLLPSRVATHSYLFHLTAPQRTLPVLNVTTAPSNWTGRAGILGMFPNTGRSEGTAFVTNNPATDYHNPSQHGIAWERPVAVEWLVPGGEGGFQVDAGIRINGSDWQRPRTIPSTKFSFRLYFRGDYGPGRLEAPLFPLTPVDSFNQIVLRAGNNEKVNPFIRDEVTRRLSHDMGQVAAHGTFALVLRNGALHTNDPGGTSILPIYNPTERINSRFMQSHLGGGPDWDVVGPSYAVSSEGLGVVDGDRNDFNSLLNYVWTQQTAASLRDPAVYREVARRLDLENFADYCLLNAYVAMGDWPANNWRAARERENPAARWRFIVWDAEWAMGIYNLAVTRDSFALTGTGTEDAGLNSTVNSEIARLYQRLVQNPEFRLLCADRIQRHFFNGGALSGANLTNRFNQLRQELLGWIPSMDTEILAWARDRLPVMLGQFNQYGLYGASNALHGSFLSSNAPVLSQHGGRIAPGFTLTLAAPLGGSIHYTTNGDDPRVPFSGAVSNTASLYAAPLVLSQSTRLKARTLLGTNWSALAEAVFEVGTLGLPVRLVEIMYNPPGGALHEFVELQNLGATELDLGGVRVEDAVSFVFPAGFRLAAGARAVLASNTDPAAWAARYPGVAVAGHYSGSLANGGERVTLRDAAGQVVQTVDYRDTAGWPVAADGAGASLEVNDPWGDPDDPANWRPSAAVHGTPGAGSAAPALPSLRLHEVLALNSNAVLHAGTRPDFVELHNAGAAAADLAGWSLGDNGVPGQFMFPAGTTVPAGGYLVVWCDSATNLTPGLHAGFELDPDGDAVFLFDPLGQRVDAVTFGRQVADRSLGRVAGGAAWQLTLVSTNAPNTAAPLATPMEIGLNEWLPNPAPGLPDWLELFNRNTTLPAALQGMWIRGSNGAQRLGRPAFLPPSGFLQLFADEAVGPDHLDFKLPAAGGILALHDATGQSLESVTYGALAEGASEGRLPDGSLSTTLFATTASPEAPNYASTWTGPVLHEVLARNVRAVTNAGRVADYVELFNPGAAPASLAGLSLAVDGMEPGQWIFPAGATLPAFGHVVVWCDGDRAASTNAGDFNTGRSLPGEAGAVHLFNAVGQLVHSVRYGPQVADRSIGLISGQWRLLAAPTPGASNGLAAALGATGVLRLNEWMADPAAGPDWLELYNPTNLPVDLGGLYLTDDLSLYGTNRFRIPSLSFIGPRSHARYLADGDPEQGLDHVDFSLEAAGEALRLYAANGGTIIDTVTFGTQLAGVSEGRLPDGASNSVRFPNAASPGAPNYTVLPGLVIQEVLTRADAPSGNAVELFNTGPAPVNVGGWFLSDRADDPRRHRLPDNSVVPPLGYLVVSQAQFNAGSTPFALSALQDGEVWLSAADAGGNLIGPRARAAFGPAAPGRPFGRFPTSQGIDYPTLIAPSLGAPNPAPRIGPVVLNEILYRGPAGPGSEDEFLELFNTASTHVALFDPANPAHTWRVDGGVRFTLPPGVTLPPGGFLLLVNFNPADPVLLAAFQARWAVPASVPVLGPFSGRLDDAGETVELRQPETPESGLVPLVVADRVSYGPAVPWPSGAVNGGGHSLQRLAPDLHGNEPLHWAGIAPTPGRTNDTPALARPVFTLQPQAQTVLEGAAPVLAAAVAGPGPISWQWRRHGLPLAGATNATLAFPYAVSADTASYDVIASNPGGSSVSTAALLRVAIPPSILAGPTNLFLSASNTAVFSVQARGDEPLAYRWRKNGLILPGATSASLVISNLQLADDGDYDVIVSNDVGIALAGANLTVLIAPVITVEPVPQTVVVGGSVTLSASYTGNPPVFTNEWRRQSIVLATNVTTRFTDFHTFTATNVPGTNRYRIFIRHRARPSGTFSALADVITVADTDGDGLPDDWETRHGLQPGNAGDRDLDTDGDGLSNAQEYTAGTDPANAADYLQVRLSAAPGQASVVFQAVSNRTYTVQAAEGLGAPWVRLADVVARTNSRVESVPDPVWSTNRVYRLVTPAPPR
jgi:hypothetical protein